jgi:hypothetical protein
MRIISEVLSGKQAFKIHMLKEKGRIAKPVDLTIDYEY